jgi:hypothetical protein
MTNLAKAHPPLVKLGIGETHITGRSLPLLANFPAITQLNAETLNLTDEDMDHFPQMPALEVLKLDNNTQLTNHAIEVILRNCPRIKLLTLRKTSVDNGGVAIARAARHKFTLAVADSHVTDFHDDNLLTITDTVPADWRIKEMGERAANAVGGRIPHRKNKMSAEIQK